VQPVQPSQINIGVAMRAWPGPGEREIWYKEETSEAGLKGREEGN
jgi:hypothetical protein